MNIGASGRSIELMSVSEREHQNKEANANLEQKLGLPLTSLRRYLAWVRANGNIRVIPPPAGCRLEVVPASRTLRGGGAPAGSSLLCVFPRPLSSFRIIFSLTDVCVSVPRTNRH